MRASSDPRFLEDIKTAIMREQPVTITYTTEDGRIVVRTVEPYDEIVKTMAGNFLIKTMDRESGKPRSWRTDRVIFYTVHRGRFVLDRPYPSTPPPVLADQRTYVQREDQEI